MEDFFMAIYKCAVCGAIFDEEKEGKKFSELDCCPVCKQPVSKFEKIADESPKEAETDPLLSGKDSPRERALTERWGRKCLCRAGTISSSLARS